MKNIVKYALILAMASTGVAFAQQAQSTAVTEAPAIVSPDGFSVVASMKDGILSLTVKGKAAAGVTMEDAIKQALKAALMATGEKSYNGHAVESAMNAIMSALADKNAPATGPVDLHIVLKPNADTLVIETKAVMSMAGEKFEATTKTEFADDGKSSKTEGNIVTTDALGNKKSTGAVVAIADGKVAVNNQAPTQTVAAESSANVVNSEAVSNDVGGGASANGENLMPDNTIVTTDSQ